MGYRPSEQRKNTNDIIWHSLNGYLVAKVLLWCAEQDTAALAKIDRRCAVIAKQLQQQQIKLSSKKNENISTNPYELQEEEEHDENEPDDDTNRNQKSSSPAIKLIIFTDPDTLLARLNTKRLFQRMQYFKKKRNQMDGKPCCNYTANTQSPSCYAIGKTTQEIALDEWRQIVQSARHRNNGNQQERENENQDTPMSPLPLPSPYELLLFSPCPRAVTVLASYPRSGNSLLRNLFERVTLRVTGSDMRGGLTTHDLVGEAAVSAQHVQFVKTHYPERRGTPVLRASRVVLLVRNPLDALDSYFHLMMTNTHTTSLSPERRAAHKHLFTTMAKREILVWQRFHEFWLQQAQAGNGIPILLVRYEDLIRFPDRVLARVLQFTLEISNMDFFESRIQHCCGTNHDGAVDTTESIPTQTGQATSNNNNIQNFGAYKPRSGGIGKSLQQYPDDLRKELLHNNPGMIALMHQLGYGEMLDVNSTPFEWKLKPIPGFAFEMKKKKMSPKNKSPSPQQQQQHQSQAPNDTILINAGPVVRGPKLRTDWKQFRKEMFPTNKQE